MNKRARLSTGVAGLDEILGGGLPEHRMYLIQGRPGTGKTTLALQFLLEGIRLGESGMYVTLSETKEELEGAAHSHDLSLQGLTIYDLASAQASVEPEKHYTMFHPSEVELSDTTKLVLAEIERANPVRIVFDSLSDMRLLAESPLRYRRQILNLKRFFSGRKCTILLLDEQSSDEGGIQMESLVHGVIAIEHNSPGFGAPRRRIRVVKLREVSFMGGYHDLNIEHGGVVIFPRLVANEHQSNTRLKEYPSGIEALDRLTGGGLQRGTTTLLMGPAGSGKSIIATQHVLKAAKDGLKPSYFTFDEVRETLLTRAEGVGMDLRELVRNGQCMLRQIDPAELTPGQFSGLVREAVEKRGSKVIVIDSLNGYYQSMPEEGFLNAHMHELLAYLNQQGVLTILVLTQQGMMGMSMPVPVDLTYLADNVLVLRYFEYAGEVKQAIAMTKKRSGYHERALREFQISSAGIQIGEPLRQFHGVLTGIPTFAGGAADIIKSRES
jgi:circadian clock protein KaiC